jgi:hypothetical protein
LIVALRNDKLLIESVGADDADESAATAQLRSRLFVRVSARVLLKLFFVS